MSNNNEEGNNMKAQDIFSEYLNFNNFHNDIMKEDFPKPNLDSYDKFNLSDESSIKSVNSMNEYSKTNLFNKSMTFESQPQSPKKYHFVNISNINNINNNNNIINNFDNIKRINFNGKSEINFNLKNNKNQDNNQNNQFLSKKKLNNIIQKKESNENIDKELKQKKLLMNRESAKKSRLKKKAYIANLEKEYLSLKTEYIRMIENQNFKNNFIYNNNFNYSNNRINPNLKIGKENVLYEFNDPKEENIQNINNDYINKQKKIMENLLINQIDMMTPINIKIMQNKFLKLNKLENNDNFQIIKNKINSNLETIKEIYDINENDTNINKQSKGYQLYDFYKNIVLLLDKYEIIISYIDDINNNI